jgi:type IV pilus assembly protein PilM
MGLFGLAKKKVATFGLDIGSSAVKIIELVPIKTGYVLKSFAMVDLPRNAINEGSIRQPGVVTEAIRECVQRAGVASAGAVISVSGRDSIVKRVPLPRVSAKELHDAIYLEAEHHIPFAIDDVFLDYQVVSESANSMSVLLVATKKVKVLEYIAVVENAGLEASVVDLDAFAIQNQYELGGAGGEGAEAVALIDIGASVMKTNVIHGGASVFARDVPFGGNNYTDTIAQRLGIPIERAEAAKRGDEVGVNWDDLVPALEAVSRELSLEVQRTFDYFASTAESERIGKIVLSGGCAKLAGIGDFLASSWGVPVELAHPLAAVDRDPPQADDEELRSADCLLAVAVGLGLRSVGDKTS